VFFATTINYLDRNVLGLHRGLDGHAPARAPFSTGAPWRCV